MAALTNGSSPQDRERYRKTTPRQREVRRDLHTLYHWRCESQQLDLTDLEGEIRAVAVVVLGNKYLQASERTPWFRAHTDLVDQLWDRETQGDPLALTVSQIDSRLKQAFGLGVRAQGQPESRRVVGYLVAIGIDAHQQRQIVVGTEVQLSLLKVPADTRPSDGILAAFATVVLVIDADPPIQLLLPLAPGRVGDLDGAFLGAVGPRGEILAQVHGLDVPILQRFVNERRFLLRWARRRVSHQNGRSIVCRHHWILQ